MQWPTNLIFTRLKQVLADGSIDDPERIDLQELLGQLIGGTTSLLLGFDGASVLPLDNPPPRIHWGPEQVYVFTGKFAYGTRGDCESEVRSRGSICEPNVTRRTSCVVIGTFGSEDWAHTSYGRKIQRAVDLRGRGIPLRIVGEDHWVQALTAVR